jgi:PAS domain S-box-containing protein
MSKAPSNPEKGTQRERSARPRPGNLLIMPSRSNLDEVQSQLSMLVQSSDDAIIGKDLNGTITSWNRGAERLYGYSPDEVLGSNISLLNPPELTDDIASIMQRVRKGETIHHYETVRMAKNGRRITVSLTVSPIFNAAGEITGASAVARDVTELKRNQETLRNSEKMAVLGRISASIAHEINNPLEALTNLTYLLATDPRLHPQLKPLVQTAQQELDRVSYIVKSTLGFYRQASRPLEVNVVELLNSVLALFRQRVRTSGVRIMKRFEAPGIVPGFPADLRQVFANLVGNALDVLPQGGILILHVRNTMDWHTHEHGVRVVIADNASGIGRDIQPRLFQPFFTTKQERGTGLGLWVSRSIVEKHHGSIRLYSSTGKHHGTVFSVFLPCAQPQQQPVPAAPDSSSA